MWFLFRIKSERKKNVNIWVQICWYVCRFSVFIILRCSRYSLKRLLFFFSLLLLSCILIQQRFIDSLCRQPVDIGYYYYFSFVLSMPCCEPSPLDTFFQFIPFSLSRSNVKKWVFSLIWFIQWRLPFVWIFVIFSVKNYDEIKFFVWFVFSGPEFQFSLILCH